MPASRSTRARTATKQPESFGLPTAVRRAIIAHAKQARPFECCGFLVGAAGRAAFALPMTNTAASTVRYRIDDHAHIELRRVLRAFVPALSIVGVYHSHPAGQAKPSETDIAEAWYPEWVYLIVGLDRERTAVRAFRPHAGQLRPVRLRGWDGRNRVSSKVRQGTRFPPG